MSAAGNFVAGEPVRVASDGSRRVKVTIADRGGCARDWLHKSRVRTGGWLSNGAV